MKNWPNQKKNLVNCPASLSDSRQDPALAEIAWQGNCSYTHP